MKIQTSIVALACLLFQYSCTSQVPSPNIILSVPTLEQEATSVWRTINDIAFLEEQGYQINLPRHDTIQFLVDKSRNKNFGNTDFGTIYNLLESGIYEKGNYEKAFSKVNAQLELINSLVQRLTVIKESWNWNFKIFDSYDIVFTIYGTGGSYDPDNGRVTLFTNEEGQFMKYDNPANTIIHEIVHMGIEESIVQKYNLSHG
ncbi:MAG: hypothetical protein AB8F74_22810, partial [Saprospiraceae bacterium]